ncbi:TonB-dependent receptor [Altererythrobacter sp. N1]|nr:TonB-dependent receptor [Altererythrobacter sp. N1]
MIVSIRTIRRHTLLCCAASSAILVAAPAVAQNESAPAQDQTETNDENLIVVTGSIRESLENATEAKRLAPNVVDVATADSVGRFPDENTAAALARLPGVAVQRDQGQARYIQVRGAPNRWTSVSIDGIPQTGVDEGGSERAYRFDAVPAVLLQQLVVNKSLTPDITAEAITANVDLQTFSPLDNGGTGFNINGDLGYGFMGLGNGEQRSASMRLSWSNDVVGIALGGSHYLRDQVTDNREASYDADGTPRDIDIRNYELERSNNGLFGTVELQASDDLRMFARGIYTEFTDKERRNAYQVELEDAEAGTRGPLTGELFNVPISTAFNDGLYKNENIILSAGFDYATQSGFGLSGKLGYTRTENSSDLPIVQSSIHDLTVAYDRSADPRFPIIDLYRTIENGDGTFSRGEALSAIPQTEQSVSRAILLPIMQGTVSDAYSGKLDVWKEFDELKVKGGLFGTYRKLAGNNIGVGGAVPLAALGFDPNGYVTDRQWNTGFPLGVDINYVDNIAMNKDLQAALEAGGIDPASFVLPTSFYDQQETILAAYAMAQYDNGPLMLTGGARVEWYEIENAGTVLNGSEATPLSTKQNFFDIFPSVNLRYEATPNLVLRLGGQRGISRPAYAAIRVGASISDTSESIGGGNPFLTPEYTWGLDASAEYYFASNGIASVAVFHRWVDDVLYQSQGVVGSDLYNSDGIDRSDYLLGSTFNGDSGTLYGIEFNIESQFDFLPGALSGFGVQGNLTLLDGQFDGIDAATGETGTFDFQGLSHTVANASLFYEYADLSLRVSYQWRSKYLDTLGGLGAGEFRDGYENLDVTVRYVLNDNLTLFADLANLTDETYVAYEGTRATPSEVEQIGSRYLFGVRFNF